MTRYVIVGAVALGLAAAMGGERSPAPGPNGVSGASTRREAHAVSIGAGDAPSLILKRDSSGQFHMTAQVNGEDLRFMVDTGADVVALTVDDAQRLGLDTDRDQFEVVGRSASGTAYGTPLRLERLEIDGHELAGVDAVVLDGLDTNLLGQSALRRLGRVELRGDTMVLHASP